MKRYRNKKIKMG